MHKLKLNNIKTYHKEKLKMSKYKKRLIDLSESHKRRKLKLMRLKHANLEHVHCEIKEKESYNVENETGSISNISLDINDKLSSNNDKYPDVNENNNFICEYSDDQVFNNITQNTEENSEDSSIISCLKNTNSISYNLEESFILALRTVFIKYNINHTQGDAILKILKTHNCFVHLPQNSKTFLKTPKVVKCNILQIGTGEYIHIGFEKILAQKLLQIPINHLPDTLEIDFSTDGAKLDNSLQFWPIQLRVANIPDRRPILVGVYKGKHKPCNPHLFMKNFVKEFLDIVQNGGISIKNRKIPIRIRCFIADGPARSFILNHQGHMSSNACSKCKVKGIRLSNTMTFPSTNCHLRTNEQYKMLLDEHHRDESPLSALPMGLVSQVPFEYMHLVLLGVTKKIITAWLEGNYAISKLSSRQINILSTRLSVARDYCPREFSRRCRDITEYKTYKATEFRTFLLYTGLVVISGIVTKNVYVHFSLLSCAIRILLTETSTDDYISFAEAALKKFVFLCSDIYGPEFISYNVHGLLHLATDVKTLGPLHSFSAFDFENYMPQFRSFIRKPHQHFQQFVKRLHEQDACAAPEKIDFSNTIRASIIHRNGPIINNLHETCIQYKLLKNGYITYGINKRDNCCILKDYSVCIIKNIIKIGLDYYFLVRKFKEISNINDYIIDSKLLGIFQCKNLSELCIVPLSDVHTKCFRLPQWDTRTGHENNIEKHSWIVTTMLPDLYK